MSAHLHTLLTSHRRLHALYQWIAPAYNALAHAPEDALVSRAYAELIAELWQQFQLLTAFVSVSFTAFDPYPGSAPMFADIAHHHALTVFTGGETLPAGHPLAERAPNGQTYNVILRAVHDGLAHFPERNQFGPIGEFRAFLAHRRLIRSPRALRALAMETIGQTAVYTISGAYAEQKANILPTTIVDTLTASILED